MHGRCAILPTVLLLAAVGLRAQATTMGPEPPVSWHANHSGPAHRTSAPDPRDAALLQACGVGDVALHRVAGHLAQRALRGLPALTTFELGERLRRFGEPHVRPQAWTLRSPRVDRERAHIRLRTWLARASTQGQRRCGVASVFDSTQGEAIAVVTVDAVADLRRPIPTRVRTGTWVTVDANVRPGATEATVVVLGPRGSPRTIPTSFDRSNGRLVARFMADHRGRWLVQVLATMDVGPLPVLESVVFAGVAPPLHPAGTKAAGEGAVGGALPVVDKLTRMLNAARSSEGLDPLVRSRTLDQLAERHARDMMTSGRFAHDAGQGDVIARLQHAGLTVQEAGENVAKAATPNLAHRALWASPSHRANLLSPRYQRVGVGAARDRRGTLWITQIFAR